MVFLLLFFYSFRRPGCVLRILVALFCVIDLYFVLDSDDSAVNLTPATFYGLRFFAMAAEKQCCVPSCGVSTEILHKFPNPMKNIERFRTWIYNIGGDILGKDNDYIYKYRRVCHLHFENKYHTRSKMLSADAVPTVNLSGHLSARKRCLSDITNQTLNIPSATPSTSGVQMREHAHDLQVTTLLSMQSRITKEKIPRMTEQKLLKAIKKLKNENDSYKQRLQKAKKLFTNTSFQKALQKFKTLAAIFTVMQFREISKPKMGRRFTKDEKIMALSMYKLGPRAYRWLSKIFILPSSVTLSRLISKANLKPGLNENIFKQLHKKANKMKDYEKICTLIFDEMAVTPHFDYSRKKDKITGFVNYEGMTKRKLADHALVFMIRGVMKNYKQPVYYSFSAGSTPKEVLACVIKKIIVELHKIGFTVVATVCDQGTSNTSAINYLIDETKGLYLKNNKTLQNYVFDVEGQTVIPLYDVPHLLKGLRNNLMTKNLKFTMDGVAKIAKWEHVNMLYENNPTYKGLKLVKNLTENHCIKDKIPKMKVKYASQLFSQTVGKTMGYLAENGILPPEAKDTADLIIFVDNLFDSMNGSFKNSKIRSGKDLLRNVTPSSNHKNVWIQSKRILKSMKFVSFTGSAGTVPSINNWLRTVENMELLRDKLFLEHDIKSLWCRHLNQDPLENFFGSIRSHGIRNVSPTCAAFEAAFASVLINNLSSNYAVGSNCEEDFCFMFKTFDELFIDKPNEPTSGTVFEIDIDDLGDCVITDYAQKENSVSIKSQIEYVTGYILRKSKSIMKNCKTCEDELFETNKNENRYISRREYLTTKTYLFYPNKNMKILFSSVQDVVYHVLKTKSEMININCYIKTLLLVLVDTNFIKCSDHRINLIDFFFDFSCRFFIFNWCKRTNKILSGITQDFDAQDSIQEQAYNYSKKRKRRK